MSGHAPTTRISRDDWMFDRRLYYRCQFNGFTFHILSRLTGEHANCKNLVCHWACEWFLTFVSKVDWMSRKSHQVCTQHVYYTLAQNNHWTQLMFSVSTLLHHRFNGNLQMSLRPHWYNWFRIWCDSWILYRTKLLIFCSLSSRHYHVSVCFMLELVFQIF